MSQTPLFDLMVGMSDNWTRVTLSNSCCENFRSLQNPSVKVKMFPKKGTALLMNGNDPTVPKKLTDTELELVNALSPRHRPTHAFSIKDHFLKY